MSLQTLLAELERKGEENDAQATERSQKYLNITRDTGQFLAVLLKAMRASSVLEIGTSNGYSTLWLASSLGASGRVTTVEASPDKVLEASDNFARAGLTHKIRQIEGSAANYLRARKARFDVVFLDAERSEYLDFADDVIEALNSGGVLVCDNAISHRPELADFMAYIEGMEIFTTCLVPVGKGEFVAYKEAE
ncbi:O-methyltransferase [Litchfieldella qijiaojingensis]|uniref:O-methyltransferase n=1 Tax=Litchfieldella qijiaojingensis TaxID=980347 RepID=A0ABQ2YZ12_9GAMM|nr:class I SAM-dependent methyltransferase [Halomonas qijiaojingensis]GGX98548.1 O-methyltransferase [Halomonas qijiaojingensis]